MLLSCKGCCIVSLFSGLGVRTEICQRTVLISVPVWVGAVFLWSLQVLSSPVRLFSRNSKLSDKIINIMLTPNEAQRNGYAGGPKLLTNAKYWVEYVLAQPRSPESRLDMRPLAKPFKCPQQQQQKNNSGCRRVKKDKNIKEKSQMKDRK